MFNKKVILLLSSVVVLTTGVVFAAKYTVNQSGTIKNQAGQTISAPSNAVNQNYYSNYQAQNYVAANQVNSEPVGIVEIVMDFSGSMSNWIGVAKRSMSSIVSQIPQTTKVGFRVFGHSGNGTNPTSIHTLQDVKRIVRKGNKFTVITERGPLGITTGACSATEQVTPIVNANLSALISGMNSVDIGGATPLVYALDRAVYQDFQGYDITIPKKIVLITDGGENCGGDPCQFAKNLMKKRSDVHIDVVLASSSSRALTCLASTTGGHFYSVDNLSDFASTMTKSIQTQPQTPAKSLRQKYEFLSD